MDINELIFQGVSYFKQRNYDEALECFNQAISCDLNCVQAYHYRCLIHRRQQNKQEALENLQQATKLLNDKEYTTISNNLQILIEQDCFKTSENVQSDNSDHNLIFYNENWYECYDDLVDAFPNEFMSYWEIESLRQECESIVEDQFLRRECWLSRQLKQSQILQEKRINNAKFDSERLQSQNLPLCNSQESIAQAMGVSVKGLRFLAFSRKKYHYIRFQIPKKTGGNRKISAPTHLLKKTQKWILENILEKIQLHDAAHGFRLKHSIVTNAEPHVGKDVIINIDLKDFFPSISYRRVKGLFKSFGYSETASTIFGLICTEPKIQEIELNGKTELLLSWTKRYLPQGAPTSPAITNILCHKLDRRLYSMAKQYGFGYTRYADDLTFSASGESLGHIFNIFQNTRCIVEQEDFDINEQKTRVIRRYQQQEVTGIVVNEKLNVSREKLKNFRAVLYQIEKDGLEGHNWGHSGDIIASIEGFANFVSMVNPEKGAKFKEQIDRIKEKYGRKNQAKVPNVSQPILNQSDIVAQIHTQLKEFRFSKRIKQIYLNKIYNKQSLQQLTDEELLELLRDLTTWSSVGHGRKMVNFQLKYIGLSCEIRSDTPNEEDVNQF
ncbi:MAG: tetratricopeptide repeat protein [Microcoleus sp. PH2017_29_MFU_D_A]|uniref:reverse transcriptase domain-containing protein n=1 Tax=unclassified Microcoleus TaxID=2642155 RepID=UPI001DA3F996|nr:MULTISPECIES: reverse transcriptase domain-containing protein [unclassified Microcoleus]MCC3588179.1 tetratricopeptide repeat protein [Microcoleus sp. PH2017_30_WIL_O_A]MCC3593510.1 tetratricopeptide repeat protein [Microcoleus sp. PH2017_28_MFU_U_A]MCC3605270.1 tetratricopeptide repeat protein [Microcoleus sp. PH2017_29_MFU_D_A]MCC3636276.1 tetratricopeptide repeat protein [Microcoleus sp. PH2017_37_MFU_D_B]